jgi:hypothetical protein
MIIALSGRMGSGKSTIARRLADCYGFRIVSLAQPLYDALERLNPYIDYGGLRYRDAVEKWGEDLKTKRPEVRRLLQVLGFEVLRELFDPDILLRPVLAELEAHEGEDIVIPDVRFLNEVEALKARDAILVRVVREGLHTWPHVSEMELSDESPQWDFTIFNRSTLGCLDEHVDTFMRRLTEGQRIAS